ncbi:MAG: hypothetical protein O7I42_01375 [Alphaproteobacteria bacterium]|nr:hypothetical protein [Alphaproteobacteria bacterium]
MALPANGKGVFVVSLRQWHRDGAWRAAQVNPWSPAWAARQTYRA